MKDYSGKKIEKSLYLTIGLMVAVIVIVAIIAPSQILSTLQYLPVFLPVLCILGLMRWQVGRGTEAGKLLDEDWFRMLLDRFSTCQYSDDLGLSSKPMKGSGSNCSSCGAELAPGQRLCGKCGSLVTATRPETDPLQLIKPGVSDKMIQLANETVEPGTSKSHFTEPDDQVVVWANVKKLIPDNAEVSFSWYSPDGTLYSRKMLNVTLPGPVNYVSTSHKIRDTSMARKFGRWKVQIYSGQRLLESVQFETSEAAASSTGLGALDQPKPQTHTRTEMKTSKNKLEQKETHTNSGPHGFWRLLWGMWCAN